jgi:hypothetical protein
MKIMVFLHGTTIMHRGAHGRARGERVRQVIEREASVRDFSSYVPIGGAVRKIRGWAQQSAQIVYMSSHQTDVDLEKDREVLQKYGFPQGEVQFRRDGEEYRDAAERVMPDILIEDDCESIGGETEMIYPQIEAELRGKIRSVVVKEFAGIDHLPDELSALQAE